MSTIKVAILGFGTVGEGVYKTLQTHAEELSAVLGKKVEVAAVLIRNRNKERTIAENVLVTTDYEDILQLPQLDVVIEAIVDKEPSFTILRKAIERGCHIITANKEMFAHHGKELLQLAEKNKVFVGFEATVAGGIPIIQTLRQLLKVNRVREIHGILNGTSNFILTEMRENKQSFDEALLLAQEKGYAEADPTNDVEGYDAFYKTMILSRIAFGEEPDWETVELAGITSITSDLIQVADEFGLRFKHVAVIRKLTNQIAAVVKLVLVDKRHPFYHVEGVENAVNVHADIVGQITLQGPGAGMFPTASAIIEDLVYVCQNTITDIKQVPVFPIEQDISKSQEFWFIQGLKAENITTDMKIIDKSFSGTFIIQASKNEVIELTHQYKNVSVFQILSNNIVRNKSLTTIPL